MSLPSDPTQPRPHAVRMPITDADREQFAKWTEPGPPPSYRPQLGPCLLFTGARKTSSGYGQYRWGGYKAPNRSAHAFAWESVNGPIPPGLTVDHLCRVTNCVRVSHMEIVTSEENYRRAVEARVRCHKGHRLEPWSGSGRRRCPTCEKGWSEERVARKRRVANGLPDRRRKHDPEDIRRAVAAVEAGRSIRAAAAEVGCSDQYLGKVIKRIRERSAQRDT